MGGLREDTAPQGGAPDAFKSGSTSSLPGAIGSVRFHHQGSEFHFHDDAAGKKVAVPVSDWYSGYRNLLSQGGTMYFHDWGNGASLEVTVTLHEEDDPAFVVPQTFLKVLAMRDAHAGTAAQEAAQTTQKLLRLTGWIN